MTDTVSSINRSLLMMEFLRLLSYSPSCHSGTQWSLARSRTPTHALAADSVRGSRDVRTYSWLVQNCWDMARRAIITASRTSASSLAVSATPRARPICFQLTPASRA